LLFQLFGKQGFRARQRRPAGDNDKLSKANWLAGGKPVADFLRSHASGFHVRSGVPIAPHTLNDAAKMPQRLQLVPSILRIRTRQRCFQHSFGAAEVRCRGTTLDIGVD
jgi:hypothetical protein